MPDLLANQRVKRMREARKASGQRETNVWVPAEVDQAIDQAVATGKFPNRRQAIIHALQRTFTESQAM